MPRPIVQDCFHWGLLPRMANDLQAAPAHDAPHQSEEFQPVRTGCVHGNARHFAGPSNVGASGPQAVLLGASASAPVPADTNLSIDQLSRMLVVQLLLLAITAAQLAHGKKASCRSRML